MRHYLRQEPYEVIPHVRICAGGAGQPAFLPRPELPRVWCRPNSVSPEFRPEISESPEFLIFPTTL